MAFPTVATSATTAQSADATSISVTMPSGVASGDLLLVLVSTGHYSATYSASGWTSLGSGSGVDGYTVSAVFYRISDGSEGSSVSFACVASATHTAIALRVTGWHGTTPPEIGTVYGGQGVSANVLFNAVTPSWGAADTLWFALVGAMPDKTVSTYPTSYTGNQLIATATGSGTLGSAHACSRDLNATTDTPGTMVLSGGARTVGFTVAVRPSVGGGGGLSSYYSSYYYKRVIAELGA